MFKYKSKYLIASGFVLVLALMIALAAVGLTRMDTIHHHLQVITEKYNVKTDIIFSMRHIVRERALTNDVAHRENDVGLDVVLFGDDLEVVMNRVHAREADGRKRDHEREHQHKPRSDQIF